MAATAAAALGRAVGFAPHPLKRVWFAPDERTDGRTEDGRMDTRMVSETETRLRVRVWARGAEKRARMKGVKGRAS